jgi:hypothetical protein
VIDRGCAPCLFLRSDDEQERFHRIFARIFETMPESLCYPVEEQIQMARRCLPYICTYKAQYKREIEHFLKATLDELVVVEEYNVDIEEEVEVPSIRFEPRSKIVWEDEDDVSIDVVW